MSISSIKNRKQQRRIYLYVCLEMSPNEVKEKERLGKSVKKMFIQTIFVQLIFSPKFEFKSYI